jgi:hypothetical protein
LPRYKLLASFPNMIVVRLLALSPMANVAAEALPCLDTTRTSTRSDPPGSKSNARYGANADVPAHACSSHSMIELFMGSIVATSVRDHHRPSGVQ